MKPGSSAPGDEVEGLRQRIRELESEARAAERARQRATSLARAGRAVSSSLDVQEVLRQIAQIMVDEFADLCGVYLVGDDGRVVRVELSGRDAERRALAARLSAVKPDRRHNAQRVIDQGSAIVLNGIDDSQLHEFAQGTEHLELLRGLDVRAAMFVPLVARDRVLGVLGVHHCGSDRTYDADDLAFAEDLASRAAMALDNALLHRQMGEGEERYRMMFEANPNPMWVFDRKTLCFLAVNRAAVAHYGYSVEEFRTMTLRDIRPPEDVQALEASVVQPEERYQAPRTWRHRRKDGQVIEVEVSACPLEFGGHPAELVLAHDVTERNRVAAELSRLNHELEHRVQERTAALQAANRELEAFSYSVSHDLRAPLRALDGFSGALLEDYAAALPAEAQRYLERIRAASQRMGGLIDDMLLLSQISQKELAPRLLDVSALASEIMAELLARHPERAVEFRVAPGLQAVADAGLVRLALTNLLENAVKFTARQDHAVIEVGAGPAVDGLAVFQVRDNGVGFDMRYAEKLFGAFQRMHGVHEFAGTGIGLATVQRVATRHGGRVWAESSPGAGATFSLALPEAGL